MTAMNLFRAAAVGAAAMYLLDPDRGRRRRAIARDKARSTMHQGTQFLAAARSDAQARMQGLRAMARRIGTGRQAPPDDRVLEARVRARLGRVVAHPHAVHVTAEGGHVRLSGPILKSEHAPLVVAVRLVRGVRSVDDRDLVLHESSQGVPSLQGQSRVASDGGSGEWTPAVRLSAIAGGGALALYGLGCSGFARLALSGTGLALVARGGANVPLGRMLAGAGDWASSLRERSAYRVQPDTSDDWSRDGVDQSGAGVLQGGERMHDEAYARAPGSQYMQGASGGRQQQAGGAWQSQAPAGMQRQALGGAQHVVGSAQRESPAGGSQPAGGTQQQARGQQQGGGLQQQAGAMQQADRGGDLGSSAAAKQALSGSTLNVPGMGGSAQSTEGSAARMQSKRTQEGDLGVGGGAGAQYAYPSTARELSQQDVEAGSRGGMP
jgi:hypothetical protein